MPKPGSRGSRGSSQGSMDDGVVEDCVGRGCAVLWDLRAERERGLWPVLFATTK